MNIPRATKGLEEKLAHATRMSGIEPTAIE
jgi:hypothetical protein